MKLSEGKLVAIEALNRIEGFEWPEWAQFAEVDPGNKVAIFKSLIDGKTAHMHGINISPDCDGAGYLVNVTKDEFESVDGWVRHNNGEIPVYENLIVQVKVQLHSPAISARLPASEFNWKDGDIEHWRYAKPRNQPEKAADTTPAHSIETLIGQHKAARAATLEARRQLDAAETAERELMRDIEAWAESQGFDIRLLDESEEKPELVITDWRDLRVGDVVRCWGKNYEMFVVDVYLDSSDGEAVFLAKTKNGSRYTVHDGDWKFIRRPTK